ncbi:BPTI/Kunitz-type proteinase inhibitor domain-containing protein [Cytophagaceae bacterium ABcell3]|nr:BPTI/Kunitz-type proteinase inhibitor domain-containing protein [Cytophagaceae bacterium ABcell3]
MKTLFANFTLALFFLLSITSCEKDCIQNDKCNLKGETGPCFGNHPGYYFDKERGECVEFLWGGCQGVRPFKSMEECQNSCHCD